MILTPAELMGAIGVTLLLGAFLLLQLERLDKEGVVYLGMNAIGAALACLSAALIPFWPFVILEGVWAISSMIALARLAQRAQTGKGVAG